MDKLAKYKINGSRYYEGNELISAGIGKLGIYKNSRRMVSDLNIPEKDYTFAREKGDIWVLSDGKSQKWDKVFIKPAWVKKYLESLEVNSDDDNKEEDTDDDIEEDVEKPAPKADAGNIGKAPEIINLTKREKLKDNEGNIIEIEVRGTREYNNCFFKLADVAKGFEMEKQLGNSITNKNSKYVEGQDYMHFIIDSNSENFTASKNAKNTKKYKPVKRIFLTYQGLLRAVFGSRNIRVSKFLDWATKTLFTAHLGTKEDKMKLSSELMGISVNVLKEVFNKTSSKLPVVYLFAIGTVGQLRVSLEIDDKYDDNLIVCKGGETNDLSRRTDEHANYYGKLGGANMGLLWYNYIDPQYVKAAETEIFQIMKQMNFLMEHKKHNELIIYSSKKDLRTIRDQFTKVGEKYMGHTKELQKELADMERKLSNIQKEHDKEMSHIQKEHDKEMSHIQKEHDKEMSHIQKEHDREIDYLKKEHESRILLLQTQHSNDIMKKDREIDKKDHELEKKDFEIEKLQRRINRYKKKLARKQ
jgi:hypothetical protein